MPILILILIIKIMATMDKIIMTLGKITKIIVMSIKSVMKKD